MISEEPVPRLVIAFDRNARSAAALDGPPSRADAADRGCHGRQQRASSSQALQQAAGEQGAAGDAQSGGQERGAGRN